MNYTFQLGMSNSMEMHSVLSNLCLRKPFARGNCGVSHGLSSRSTVFLVRFPNPLVLEVRREPCLHMGQFLQEGKNFLYFFLGEGRLRQPQFAFDWKLSHNSREPRRCRKNRTQKVQKFWKLHWTNLLWVHSTIFWTNQYYEYKQISTSTGRAL